jgi:hypothetical protein
VGSILRGWPQEKGGRRAPNGLRFCSRRLGHCYMAERDDSAQQDSGDIWIVYSRFLGMEMGDPRRVLVTWEPGQC